MGRTTHLLWLLLAVQDNMDHGVRHFHANICIPLNGSALTYLITVNAVNAVGHGENISGICMPPKTTMLSTSYPHQQMTVYNLPSSK